MSGKKNKGLALQLINDLLGDESDQNGEDHGSSKQVPEADLASRERGREVSKNSPRPAVRQPEPLTPKTQVVVSQSSESSNDLGAAPTLVPSSKNEGNEDERGDLSLINDLLSVTEAKEDSPSSAPEYAEPEPDRTEVLARTEAQAVPGFSASQSPSPAPVASEPLTPSTAAFSSRTEAILSHSEGMRLAQQRILDLEGEVERLRLENEQLAAAGETVKRKSEEHRARADSVSTHLNDLKDQRDEERQLQSQALANKERQLQDLRMKVEELEMRLSTNIQKIRVRERELENRLELAKLEGSAIVRNKDEMILSSKRQIDQLNIELDNYRNKGQELGRHLSEKNELLRRTVKALRLALSMLEGDELSGSDS